MPEIDRPEHINEQRLYSPKDANLINRMVGLDSSATRIDAGYFLQEALPLIRSNPQDRELYIGWDVVDGKLTVTEVTQGFSPEEVDKENLSQITITEGVAQAGLVGGGVKPQSQHLVELHTHSPIKAQSFIVFHYYDYIDPGSIIYSHAFSTPRSWPDYMHLLMDPKTYISFVLDIKVQRGSMVGRALAMVKKLDAPAPTAENNELMALRKELFRAEYNKKYKYSHAKQIFLSRNRVVAILQQDEHWINTAHIDFFRGKFWDDTSSTTLLRSDRFYDKLVTMRKKFF